jgi:hypothetical protein
MKSDGRRLGRGKIFSPANEINAAIVQQTTLRLEQEERVRQSARLTAY